MTLIPSDLRDSIAGDLHEEYLAMRGRVGPARARMWLLWNMAHLAITFRFERTIRGRGLPPIADELRSTMTFWDSLRQDLSFGVRMLRRQPGFTAVALIALTLGIGANTAIFSIVDAVLWRPLPYPDAPRIMSLAEQRPRESRWFGVVAPADFYDWQRDVRTFDAVAAYTTQPENRPLTYNLTGSGDPERVRAIEVTPPFLKILGVVPAIGRDFQDGEDTRGRHRIVLLSDDLWRRRFGADPAIVGRTIAFDGTASEVIGILPRTFWWPSRPEIVVPLALDAHDRSLRAAHFLDVIGRLREGVTEAQAREDLRAIGARLAKEFPGENANHFPNMRPLRDSLVGDTRQALLVLLGAVGVVLLIACANVATLLLARSTSRQKELSVRRAVGASRGRLVRQMLTESLVIALVGGACGLLLAAWALAVFRVLLPAQLGNLPGVADVTLDGRILTMALALAAFTGMLFGIIPSLVASDTQIGASLTEETRGGSGSARAGRVRASLMVAELALSLVLLVGAALLIVSFRNLTRVSPGFQAAQLLTVPLGLPGSRYATHQQTTAFFDALYERLRQAPGTQLVAATSTLPFQGTDSRLNLEIENRVEDGSVPVRAHARLVSSAYFSTMGIPILSGRAFTERDGDASIDVAVINEAAARRYWPGSDPIGHRVSLGSPARWREIVGIAADTRQDRLDADAEPAAYLPQHQVFVSLGIGFERSMTIVVRTSAGAVATASAMRAAVKELDPQLPLGAVKAMTELIDDSVAPQRLNFVLVTAFAIVAVVLTAAGLYGVMSYLVAQRTREIGVRMALGATPSSILRLVLRQVGAMTLAGIGVGLAGALAMTRFLATLLFGVSTTDPLVYAGVALLLTIVALIAVVIPSARAARVDPLTALR